MRHLSALLALLCLLGLGGCGAKTEGDGAKLSVVASAFPEYDLTRAVAGELCDVKLLLKPGAEAHSYEPSPQDIIAIQSCGLFVYGGGESDVWLDRVLDSGAREKLRIVSLMDCAELREEEVLEGMTAEAEHEEEAETEYDEHVWTSPMNAMRIVEALRAALSEADPKNAAAYAANAKAYTEKLTALDAKFRDTVAAAGRKLLVFGDRFPFLYFTREYGLSYVAAFPGCSSGTDANPATVAWLIDTVREAGIPVVLKCDLSAGKLADTIAEPTGARVLTLYSCHTLSRADFEAGETYLSLMERNVETIKEALG